MNQNPEVVLFQVDRPRRVWPERFARQHGTLRAVVERVVRESLECGLLEHGTEGSYSFDPRTPMVSAFCSWVQRL